MLPPRSYLFFGLNAIRAISVISMLLVFSSTVFVMVTNIKAVNAFEAAKQNGDFSTNSTDPNAVNMLDCDYIEGSTVPNQAAGVFWAVVSSLLVIFQVIVLLLSELSWPMKFFDRFFPVLGSNFGLGALGIFQCLIGAQILSHHVDDFTLGAAMLLFSVGCLNILLGLIFRESAKGKRSIVAWRNEGKGVLPMATGSTSPVFVNALPPQFAPALHNGHPEDEKARYVPYPEYASPILSDKATLGFGRQGEKAAGLRGFILQRPVESLPRYAPPPPPASNSTPQASPQMHAKRISIRSSTSSFASPSQPQSPALSYEDSRPTTPVNNHAAPAFRSSPTAL
ncbi:hypothetical protein CCMSSC00406_0005801 [Pleurotus cornucopiae]|uniref:Uncharacterized protein n=1 Tax=Pleurotus cornucopiae TaxID=5321 RepID=A0ACB7J7P2_PLECO|nr:hypothetical protein CCMSSC00406_0005801 [Pleurotus cornucopiae]